MSKDRAGWTIQSEEVYETFKTFQLCKSIRVNPRTQEPIEFFLMRGVPLVYIIALTPDQQVVLVRQYRHGSEEYTLEIPGGYPEHGEDLEVSALRELREETGYLSQHITKLGTINPNPAMQDMRCHCYLALNAFKAGEEVLNVGKDIRATLEPLGKVLEKIRDGEITHSLVISAFALYLLNQQP